MREKSQRSPHHLLFQAFIHSLSRPKRVPVDLSTAPKRCPDHSPAVRDVEDALLLKNLTRHEAKNNNKQRQTFRQVGFAGKGRGRE